MEAARGAVRGFYEEGSASWTIDGAGMRGAEDDSANRTVKVRDLSAIGAGRGVVNEFSGDCRNSRFVFVLFEGESRG